MTDQVPLDGSKIGHLAWPRFLVRHFACGLTELNAQLPQPEVAGEVFRFGVQPEPHTHPHMVPDLFERAYELGKNPNGRWTPEWSKKGRFNLFIRTLRRVPQSYFWFLLELRPFLDGECPGIDFSDENADGLMASLHVQFVSDQAVQRWLELDEAGVDEAEKVTLEGLISCGLPETTGLLMTLLHCAVWQDRSEDKQLIERLSVACMASAQRLASSPVFGPDDDWIRQGVTEALGRAVDRVRVLGKRSLPTFPDVMLQIPRRLILFPACKDVWGCMEELQGFSDRPWGKLRIRDPAKFVQLSVSPSDQAKAGSTLGRAAAHLATAWMKRAEDHVDGIRKLNLPHRCGMDDPYHLRWLDHLTFPADNPKSLRL